MAKYSEHNDGSLIDPNEAFQVTNLSTSAENEGENDLPEITVPRPGKEKKCNMRSVVGLLQRHRQPQPQHTLRAREEEGAIGGDFRSWLTERRKCNRRREQMPNTAYYLQYFYATDIPASAY